MHQTRVKTIAIFTTTTVLFFGVLFLFVFHRKELGTERQNPAPTSTLSFNGATIAVSVAETPEEHAQGLSGTALLPAGTGKFFLFDHDERYGFWMKDMRYALDIVWIAKDGVVADITRNATPASYPEVFYPKVPVRFVLEVPAGFSTQAGLEIGTQTTFKK